MAARYLRIVRAASGKCAMASRKGGGVPGVSVSVQQFHCTGILVQGGPVAINEILHDMIIINLWLKTGLSFHPFLQMHVAAQKIRFKMADMLLSGF